MVNRTSIVALSPGEYAAELVFEKSRRMIPDFVGKHARQIYRSLPHVPFVIQKPFGGNSCVENELTHLTPSSSLPNPWNRQPLGRFPHESQECAPIAPFVEVSALIALQTGWTARTWELVRPYGQSTMWGVLLSFPFELSPW